MTLYEVIKINLLLAFCSVKSHKNNKILDLNGIDAIFNKFLNLKILLFFKLLKHTLNFFLRQYFIHI